MKTHPMKIVGAFLTIQAILVFLKVYLGLDLSWWIVAIPAIGFVICLIASIVLFYILMQASSETFENLGND